jgi:hypothetical protein
VHHWRKCLAALGAEFVCWGSMVLIKKATVRLFA